MRPPSQLAQYALYAASAVSAASVAGHTQMGFEVVLPALRRLAAGKKDEDGTAAAKIGWWEVNQVFGVMAILYAKWARFGINDNYERSILLLGAGYQFICGAAYARAGIYPPLVALWLGPGLAAVSQLL